ncbi:MAG: hypothetical protein M0R80_13290 [Proteobacteria bacterium]|jgi:hypothetical protein|nr:hypothetical protein [Pseudomonadota bacterium]
MKNNPRFEWYVVRNHNGEIKILGGYAYKEDADWIAFTKSENYKVDVFAHRLLCDQLDPNKDENWV